MTISMQMVILLVLLALAFDFMNGFHDSANSIATVVSTGVLKPKHAVAFAAFFNVAAIFFFQLKVASTIVAISSIHLLQVFLNADKFTDGKLMWLTIIHMAFVVSALLLAYIDSVMSNTKKSKD